MGLVQNVELKWGGQEPCEKPSEARVLARTCHMPGLGKKHQSQIVHRSCQTSHVTGSEIEAQKGEGKCCGSAADSEPLVLPTENTSYSQPAILETAQI